MPKPTFKAVNLKMHNDTRTLIDCAAQMQGLSRTDFMAEESHRAVEDAILDQTAISIDAEAYGRFVAMLDAPP